MLPGRLTHGSTFAYLLTHTTEGPQSSETGLVISVCARATPARKREIAEKRECIVRAVGLFNYSGPKKVVEGPTKERKQQKIENGESRILLQLPYI